MLKQLNLIKKNINKKLSLTIFKNKHLDQSKCKRSFSVLTTINHHQPGLPAPQKNP
ncbi:hypothetical protein DOY81_006890 [Sarcophaga bullata]|nr:hypothetical protein DOY81_006890 [Sarcophaga bullata]